NQIFVTSKSGKPVIAGITDNMAKAFPVYKTGVRYFFAEKSKDKLKFLFYNSEYDTLIKLKKPSLDLVNFDRIKIKNISFKQTELSILLVDSTNAYILTSSKSNPKEINI